jgi:hypothetical protein
VDVESALGKNEKDTDECKKSNKEWGGSSVFHAV